MDFYISHDGRETLKTNIESSVELGYPADAIRAAIGAAAGDQINQVHAQFMRDLTGNATIEERDTWKTKEEAARAMIAGKATDGQTAMITLEAQGDGTDPAALAATIVAKAEGYQTLIGMAAGLKTKAKAAIAQATGPDVSVDQIQGAIDQVFGQITSESATAIVQWQSQGAS